MKLVGIDDWVCFLDHDATWTTRDWYHQLEEIVARYPKAGMFTAVTNRIGNPHQLINQLPKDNHDIAQHRKVGQNLQNSMRAEVIDATESQLVSGVVILIKKSTWQKVGGFKSGFLGVDNDMHSKIKDAGMKVYIMPGVYVYHWYRGDGDTRHLKR